MEEVIKIENIYKSYILLNNIEYPVLKNINLTVKKGDFVAIMGPSGSGKSTFMNILGCLDSPTQGSYYLDRENVATMEADKLADIRNSKIGFVFQGFNLLQRRNICDNVTLPLIYSNIPYVERRERAEKILESVNLKGYADHFPNQLSGGMQQRVAIARALINNPKVIFADEPTGNLDSKTSDEIMKIFQNLNEDYGITIVMVTHENDIANYTKRFVFIKDGIKEVDCSIADAKLKKYL